MFYVTGADHHIIFSKQPGGRFGPGWEQNTFFGAGAGVWSGIIGQDSHIFARAGARIGGNPSPIIHGAGNPDRFLIIFLLSENNCFM
ncbi:MAG: hypothetical protein GY820_11005 [Gammaproteobacteria bacterium]|nr:hypothetical protein [Gammaproteobacteria bacterium]